MLRYLRLYPWFVTQNLQGKVEYKLDFWLGVFGSLMMQASGVAFIWVVFTRIPDLNGWSFYQVAFIYGLAALPKGLTEFFFDGVWYLTHMVRLGELDRLLVRPLDPLYHLLANNIETHGLGHLVVGGLVMAEASRQLGLSWDAARLAYLGLAMLCGALIYLSINLCTACQVFWTTEGRGMTMMLPYSFSEFAKFPITIYPRLLQAIITWALPFAFTSFFPAAHILGQEGWRAFAYLLPLVTTAFLAIAYSLWRWGLNSYQGVGT
ncbi:MAG: ABC-2 family transporter protein [Chloroflexota bacterium]